MAAHQPRRGGRSEGALNVGAGAPARLPRRLGWGDYRLELDGPATGATTRHPLRRRLGRAGQGRRGARTWSASRAGTKSLRPGRHRRGHHQAALRRRGPDRRRHRPADRLARPSRVGRGRRDRPAEDLRRLGRRRLCAGQRDPAARPGRHAQAAPGAGPGLRAARSRRTASSTCDSARRPRLRLQGQLRCRCPSRCSGLRLGQRAQVTVAAVDEGILQLTKLREPRPGEMVLRQAGAERRLPRRLRPPARPQPRRAGQRQLRRRRDRRRGPDRHPDQDRGPVVRRGRDRPRRQGDGQAAGRRLQRRAAADGGGLDRRGRRLGASKPTDRARAGGRRPRPAALPGAGRPGLRDARAAQPRGQARRLHRRGHRPAAASLRQLPQAVPAWPLGQRIAERVAARRAAARAGIGKVELQGHRPGLLHRRDYPIQTRLGWGPQTRDRHRPAAAGRGLHARRRRCWPAWRPATVTMQVSYSPFRGFDPAPIAAALSRYPYGCTEQLVSAAYPLLYAAEVSTDPKLRARPAGAQRGGRPAARPPDASTAPSASGGSATARPTPGSAPTPPTS